MEVIRKSIDELTPDPGNVRKHSNKNIDAIKASLNRFGQQKPIVCDKKMCVRAGNGTLQAAKELGWTHINVVVSKLDRADLIAYGIADNRTSELAEWDVEGLEEQLAGLDEELAEIAYADFDLSDLDEDDVKEGKTDDDAVPEVDDNPYGVQLGDLWQLGAHRLMCGDSTDKENVDKLMDGHKADMVFTDIPYNISQKSSGLRNLDYGDWDKGVHDIGLKTFYPDLALSFYYFCDDEQLSNILIEMKKSSLSTRSFVWHKKNPTVLNGDKLWLPSQELCAFGRKPKAIFNKHCAHAFWEGSPDGDRVHPCQKPVALVLECVEASSNKNGIVVDLFLGSGSTLIACEKTNRTCYGMELEPHYCSVIIKRWEDFTGEKAVKL